MTFIVFLTFSFLANLLRKSMTIYCNQNKFKFILITINKISISIYKKRQCTNSDSLVCSIGPVATVAMVLFFWVIGLCFFLLLNIYMSCYIYCYTDTINFTIFSQLLRCQFLIGRNKIIKY